MFLNDFNEGWRDTVDRSFYWTVLVGFTVKSPETWVMLPEILVMLPEKESQVARRNKY